MLILTLPTIHLTTTALKGRGLKGWTSRMVKQSMFLHIAGKSTVSYNLKIMKEKVIIPIILGALAAYIYKFTGSLAINLVIAGCISAFVVQANRLKVYIIASLPVAIIIGIVFTIVFELLYPDSHSIVTARTLGLFSLFGFTVSLFGLLVGVVFRGIWERRSISASNK